MKMTNADYCTTGEKTLSTLNLDYTVAAKSLWCWLKKKREIFFFLKFFLTLVFILILPDCRQPDLSRVIDLWHVADAGHELAAAAKSHVTVVRGANKPAADAHVQTADDHDASGDRGEEDELEQQQQVYYSLSGNFSRPNFFFVCWPG